MSDGGWDLVRQYREENTELRKCVKELEAHCDDLQARLDKSVAGESAAYAKLAELHDLLNELRRD